MFIKKSLENEIVSEMQRHLVEGAINKQAEQIQRLVKAADHLNAAAELCDESGLFAYAEVITAVLESLAAKKNKKKKNKAKAKVKNKKPIVKVKKAPTSEQMVNNLKEKGWVFDESDAHDDNCSDDNCASCGDMLYANDPGVNDEPTKNDNEAKDDSDEEIYSMLEDFKKNNPAEFEDELDFDTDADDVEVQVHDPFKNFKKIYL